MDIARVIEDIADALKQIDLSGNHFKNFEPGVGPYGEPQVVKLVAMSLNAMPRYAGAVKTKRNPDLLIQGHWALEIKLVRPFGNNGRPAENWSVNLLHPYDGNSSLLGDCLKLQAMVRPEQKGVVAIGYEHDPPKISLDPLWQAFEVVAAAVLNIHLGRRAEARRDGLIHPIHQRLVVVGWEVNPGMA